MQFELFAENQIVTKPGEAFPLPLTYQGSAVYFTSLEQVKVPTELQADVASALDEAFKSGAFMQSKKGWTETGRVTIDDNGKQRIFEAVLTKIDANKEYEYHIESLLEVTDEK